MDGVLAKWEEVPFDITKEAGFFLSRDPEICVIYAVKRLHDMGYDVSILSSVYQDEHSAKDKSDWLKYHGLADIPKIFVPYGENKANYIKANGINILVDDYSKNLHEWVKQPGNIGIKFRNDKNGQHGTWKGHSVSCNMSTNTLVSAFISIAEMGKGLQ